MIRSENSLKKDLKGFLLQGLFILIFFVLFFMSAILPTLTTFVKTRITKVVKWQPTYSSSGADRIIHVLFSTHLCCFLFIFSEFYLVFFSHQIIRAKIEPWNTILCNLRSILFICLNYMKNNVKRHLTKFLRRWITKDYQQ